MRYLLPALLAPILAVGCSSHARGGMATTQPLSAAQHVVVLVPLGDAERDRVPLAGTGERMTAAVLAALQKDGFTVTVSDGRSAKAVADAVSAAGAALVVQGRFWEWEPDLRLALDASVPTSLERVAVADCAIGTGALAGRDRGAAMADLAKQTVAILATPHPMATPRPGEAYVGSVTSR